MYKSDDIKNLYHFIYLRQDTQKSYTMKSFLIAALAATLLVQTFAEPGKLGIKIDSVSVNAFF